MAVLSIHSSVAYGHVGNAAAVFCLQRLGLEVWPVDTVRYSNHPGHGSWRGTVADADDVAAIVEGIGERGAFARCRAVLSGHLGTPLIGRRVLEAVDKVRAAAPAAVYCCDPVIGDDAEGFYVSRELASFLGEEAVPRADIVTPNAFELGWLAGTRVETADDALAAADAVIASGPRVVVVTSLAAPGGDPGAIGTLAVAEAGAWLVATPRLASAAKGAGDILAALFLGRYLEGGDVPDALSRAVSSVHGIIAAVGDPTALDLPLVAAQGQIVAPGKRFAAQRIR